MRTKCREWQQKLLLVKILQKQKMSSLSRVLYEEQLKLGWSGLAEEARKICDKIGLPFVNLVKTRKDNIQSSSS